MNIISVTTLTRILVGVLLLMAVSACGESPTGPRSFRGAPVYPHVVVETYPHDPQAYTQGLVFHDGQLYEGTGQYGESTLRKVQLDSGKVLQQVTLPTNIFGEGIAVAGDSLFQLTWRAREGYVYDVNTLERTGSFHYTTEGWGLAYDGEHLVMSDGSSFLQFIDPESRRVVKTLAVWDGVGEITGLNELEVIGGELYANVMPTDLIARIDLTTGEVRGWIYLRDLRQDYDVGERAEVLNGIAFDDQTGRLYVTGKDWSKLFEIELFD